jgi:uncharacterized surface protein with fasciclin (FAS1) repeats
VADARPELPRIHRLDESVVIAPDLRAANGVVHIIDRVLIPPAK